ncbi:MAG: tryptophan 7-halogenase [Pseudomonas sp.]|uniref:tryptophan 7-halogenase n=1 Tax=Pseudomonas sp. TaxID=306 RepID=UPI003392C6E9
MPEAPAAPVRCRVAIIGGGPAGCASALALAQRGIDGVVIVEAGDYGRPRVGESLPPDIRLLLDRLGVWPAFQQQGHERCLGSCSLWGSDVLGHNDFLGNPHGSGWHLDRQRFERWLCEQARARGATLLSRSRLGAVTATADGYRVVLHGPERHGHEVRADYLIDASGQPAHLARRLGARKLELDQLISLQGFFSRPADTAASRLTLLEAVEYGWWYRASLPGERLCIALTCDRPSLRSRGARDWRRWLNLLAATRHCSRDLQGHAFQPAQMILSTAPSCRLEPLIGPRWLAVGDAAASFDPLMARGVHKALEDGLAAAGVIAGWMRDDDSDARTYVQQVEQRYDQFRQMRSYFYGQERRWPDSPFWLARQARV